MADGRPHSRPRFFPDDEESNISFMKKKLGEESTRRSSVIPSDVERQPSGAAAAIRAIVDDDDDDDDGVPSSSSYSSSSTTIRPGLEVLHLDVAARPDAAETSAAAAEPTTSTLWTRLQAGWEEVEDRLVEWFGLDQSKYQWAVDEMLERQLAGDQPAFNNANEVGLQMQNFEEQSMQGVEKIAATAWEDVATLHRL